MYEKSFQQFQVFFFSPRKSVLLKFINNSHLVVLFNNNFFQKIKIPHESRQRLILLQAINHMFQTQEVPEDGKFKYLPARFFSTTTTPLPSAAGCTPTVFLCTKPLKRKEFLDFRLLGSCHINGFQSDNPAGLLTLLWSKLWVTSKMENYIYFTIKISPVISWVHIESLLQYIDSIIVYRLRC